MEQKKYIPKITHYVGFMIYADLWDNNELTKENLDAYHQFKVEVKKFKKNPDDTHYTLIWDFPGDDDFYGGNYKCFLYEDKKIIGHFHYVKEAKIDDEKIDGKYSLYADKIIVKAFSFRNDKKESGIYMQLETIKQ